MILDERSEFADATLVAAAAGTALIGDVIDLGIASRDIGNGQDMFFGITVDTEIITDGSAGTVRFQLVSDAQAAIATDGSATVHLDTGTFATGAAASNPLLLPGKVLFFGGVPLQGRPYERYLGVLAITATTTTTAGRINAFMTIDKFGWKAYAKAPF